MLVEYRNVKQIPAEGKRRWFNSEYFDLIVWFDNEADIKIGFQLCYDKKNYERSLTWIENKGFNHMAIDSGDSHPLSNSSPILITDGVLDNRSLYQRFLDESANIPADITKFVLGKIDEYGKA